MFSGFPLSHSYSLECLQPESTPEFLRQAERQQLENKIKTKDALNRQLNEDWQWFIDMRKRIMIISDEAIIKDGLNGSSSRRNPTAKIASVQQRFMSRFLKEIQSEKKFVEDPKRAERLIVALTLYGEFNTNAHRSLPHLFWANQVIQNRANLSPWKDQAIDSRYDPKGEASQFFRSANANRASMALVKSQFSSWNPGDSNLSKIILANSSIQTRDIVEFVAAQDAGIVVTKDNKELPILTHYISPGSLPIASQEEREKNEGLEKRLPKVEAQEFLVDRIYPNWWFDSGTLQRYTSQDLPEIIRLDQDNKAGLVSVAAGSYESKVNPRHFVGIRRRN